MNTILRRFALLPLLGVLACGETADEPSSATDSDEEDLTAAGSYVPIADYWKTEADQTRWFSLRRNLDQAFDDICGDTFCGGDYTNLESLGLNCSVSKKTGRVAECVWAFAGSQEQVNAKTGKVSVDAPYFLCKVKTKAFANALLSGLEADPLYTTVPGAKTNLYDLIGECFNSPLEGTPLTGSPSGSFVEAPRQSASEADQSAWYDGRYALKASFNEVCGDTFCGGDYSNLQSLRFVCGVNGKTDALGQCLWTFAGSHDTVAASNGQITSNVKRFLCAIPAKGTASALGQALTAPGDVPAIRRTLPGSTKSAYDALVGCLLSGVSGRPPAPTRSVGVPRVSSRAYGMRASGVRRPASGVRRPAEVAVGPHLRCTPRSPRNPHTPCGGWGRRFPRAAHGGWGPPPTPLPELPWQPGHHLSW